jgi:antitoxin FitA
MEKSITIRHVPAAVRDELAARAARQGQSLQEFVLRLLTRVAATPPMDELMGTVRARKRATGTRISADEILALKDADRR